MVTMAQIRAAVAEIAQKFRPQRIILFGSYGYGRPTRHSDVDILVLIEGKRVHENTSLWIFTPRAIKQLADQAGYTKIIEDAGGKWENIVDVLAFLTDMSADFPAFNRLYAEYFAGDGNPNPTRTTIATGNSCPSCPSWLMDKSFSDPPGQMLAGILRTFAFRANRRLHLHAGPSRSRPWGDGGGPCAHGFRPGSGPGCR